MIAKKPGYVYVLRTCDAKLQGYQGFQWPESGPAACPDWDPKPGCGAGLHGLLWGEGGSYVDWADSARWMIVEVLETDIVMINDKVKFPKGNVVFVGDRKAATDAMQLLAPGKAIIGAYVVVGEHGHATAGYGGILNIKWYDGARYRTAVFYVGEDGIKANVAYRCSKNGKALRVEK